jgi:hypothetical protein
MSERQGVEVDYCPECRGVWLDRGELDKIIARSAEQTDSRPAPQQQPYYQQPEQHCRPQEKYHNQGHGYQQGHGHKPYRKKSFLEELFD